jgi:hypothetical protein
MLDLTQRRRGAEKEKQILNSSFFFAPLRLCVMLPLLSVDMPPDFRREIFLLGVIYCLLVLGITLWRSRWRIPAVVAVSIIAAVLFGLLKPSHTQLNNTLSASLQRGSVSPQFFCPEEP